MFTERNLEPPEIEADFCCEKCNKEMYGDDLLFWVDGVYMCYECFLNAVINKGYNEMWMKENFAEELAELMMIDVYKATEAKENAYAC